MPLTPLAALLRDNKAVVYVGISTVFLTLGQGVAIPIVPLYGNSLGFTTAQVGLAVSAFAMARFMTNLPSALISDRTGRRSVLIGGALIAALGNILSGFAETLTPLLMFRFIAGIGSAAFITVSIAYIADVSTPQNRARLMSFYQGTFLAGITMGPIIGGVIADLAGLETPFFFVGIVSIFSALWTLWIVPETRRAQPAAGTADATREPHADADAPPPTPSEEQPPPDAMPAPAPAQREGLESVSTVRTGSRPWSFMLGRNYILIAMIFMAVFYTRGGALFTLLPLKARNELALSSSEVGLLLTLPAVSTIVLLPLVGFASDRYGRKSTIVPGMALFAVGLLVLGIGQTMIPFAIGMVLYGIAQGMEGPAPVAYVSDVTPPNAQAMGQGMARTLGDLALLSAAPLMGFITDVSGSTVALLGNAVAIGSVGIVFLVLAKETSRRRTEGQESEGAPAPG